jgi:multidrug efflux system membrane fusion protein
MRVQMSSRPESRHVPSLLTRVTLTLLAVLGCSKAAPPPPPADVPVNVAIVRRGSAPRIITANGQMNPLETSRVVAQVSGLITDVSFREGDWVEQGQVLFRIEPQPYQDALAQAHAQLVRDTATSTNSLHSADRLAALARDDYATRSSVDSAVAIAAANRGTVAYDSAVIKRAQFDVGNTVIRAPISGRTGSFLIRRGNYVQADPNLPLVVINRVDPILVQFSVPGAVFSELQSHGRPKPLPVRVSPTDPGTAAGSTAPSSAAADSAMGVTPVSDTTAGSAGVQGMLSFIDNAVDTTTGMVRLKAQLDNHDRRLWPGQFVFISLQLSVQTDALLIPSQAVELGQQPAVYVLQANGQVARRPIALGAAVGQMVVVARGLAEGERVITDGMSRLRAGARVRVVGVDSLTQVAVSAP